MKNIVFILALLISSFHLVNAQSSDSTCSAIEDEMENNSALNVFPNPTNGTFRIIYGSTTACPPAGWGGTLIVNIKNSDTGKEVYSETITSFDGEYDKTIDLSEELRGLYIIEIVIGSKMKIKREVLE